jgi:ribosomal-protein-alanine N-acetyltransferase
MSRYIVRPMRFEDIDAVGGVERECFSTPWPASAYRRELRDNRLGRYIVLVEAREEGAAAVPPPPERPADDPSGTVRRAVGQLLRPFGRVTTPLLPPNERLVGFAGMWLMMEEAHVTTIGVKRDLRGQGLGELLFATLLEIAMQVGARRSTLEVRITNQPAQALYKKYGFRDEGVRRRYYSDNNEDALIMGSEWLNTQQFVSRYRTARADLDQRLGDLVEVRTS